MNQLDDLSSLLDESIIAEYLEQNPEFFTRHPRLLANLNLPSQQAGTISLVQRQQNIMRQKVTSLEDEITSLMGMATQNQALYQKFTKLFFELLNCTDIVSLEQTLSAYCTTQLSLDNASLMLFHDNAPAALSYKRQQLENLIVQRLGRQAHYFGRINQQEQILIFNQQIDGSIALISLGEHGELGLLAISSKDANHFHPEMDNLMLMQLCRLISSLINRML